MCLKLTTCCFVFRIRLKTCVRKSADNEWNFIAQSGLWYERAMAGASTERCIYSPSSAFSYVHICFSLFLEKQACLSWEHPLCWNHTCSECVVSGSDVFALRPEICGIQEAAYLQSKHCVAEHRLIQQHGCAQYKQDLTPYNNTVQIHTGWHRCCFGHHFKKKKTTV